MRRRLCTAVLVAFGAGVSWSAPAVADWPAHRHDAARTATGTATSDIRQPQVAWRHYLGGTLNANQLALSDLDADGNEEIVLISGGAVCVSDLVGTLRWCSPSLDLTRIEGIVDPNGDSLLEIVASSSQLVYVLAAKSGAVLWSSTAGRTVEMGAVRIADFNRDAKPDLYIADIGCGVSGSIGDNAAAWGFADGFANPVRLFQLERGRRDYACALNDLIVDVNGDGHLDIVANGTNRFYVHSGADGSLIAESDDIGSIPYGAAFVQAANVDSDAAIEIVAYTDNRYARPLNSRRVFMIDWDVNASRPVKRWERSAQDLVNDRHDFGTGGVGDVGNDGSLEVVTSFFEAATETWTTLVLDARTGGQKAGVSEGPFRGLVDLTGDGSPEVVMGDRRRGTFVYEWHSGQLGLLFSVPRFEPITTRARFADGGGPAQYGPLAWRNTVGGKRSLLGLSFGEDLLTTEALLVVSSSGAEVGRVSLDSGASIVAAVSGSFAPPRSQLVLARNDGYVWPLDGSLTTTARALRGGSFYSGSVGIGRAPLAADLNGDGCAEIIAGDSRQALVRLDVSRAGLSTGARRDWELPGGRLPVLADLDGDGARELVYWTSARSAALRAVRTDDTRQLWQRTIGSFETFPSTDLMAGDADGDGKADIVYSLTSNSDGNVRINVAKGSSGAALWTSDFATLVAGHGLGVGSLFDREGDGKVDVLAAPRNLLQWLSGPEGIPGLSVAAGYPDYGIVKNLDGDPALEIMCSGGGVGSPSFEWDFTPRWAPGNDSHARVNGAVVRCSETDARFVGGYSASARISSWSMSNGTLAGDVFLADGKASPGTAVVSASSGRLGNLIVSPDLTGEGRTAALVPSTDGRLYALDPCAMSLLWTIDLGAPVGEPILADTDGDGLDEIVVTAADGFLYGIDQEVMPPPAYVFENDGSAPVSDPSDDVDILTGSRALYANWAPVPGALRYEYAVLDELDHPLLPNVFEDAGNTTSVDVTTLVLTPGRKYRFAVRAVGKQGRSVDTASDGVVVLASPCDACGIGTACVDGICIATTNLAPDAAVAPGSASGGEGDSGAHASRPRADALRGGGDCGLCAAKPARSAVKGGLSGALLVIALLTRRTCRRRARHSAQAVDTAAAG